MSLTLESEFKSRLQEARNSKTALSWPSRKYEHNFEQWALDVCAIRMWSKQREFALLLQNCPRVAVKAGQKVSKTLTLLLRALHVYCTFEDGRAWIVTPVLQQIDDALWPVLTWLVERSREGICIDCREKGVTKRCEHAGPGIDGQLNSLCKNGLVSGRRSIKGLSPTLPNAISSRSGVHQFWLVDEVIGVRASILRAIDGTTAGGSCWLAMASNPTEYDVNNVFCRAFTLDAEFYSTITISSYDSPNVTGEMHVPGCCDPAWIKMKEKEWGKDSDTFKGRILGEFPARSIEAMLSPSQMDDGEDRWHHQDDDDGVTAVGIDVAGSAVGNDSWSFTVRRGNKLPYMGKIEGYDVTEAIGELHRLLSIWRRPDEIVQVAFDASAHCGKEFGNALGAYSRKYSNTIYVCAVYPSASPPNDRFDRLRDFLLWQLIDLIQRVLGVPFDPDFRQECLTLKWDLKRTDTSGKDKVISKYVMRQILGRSTDLLDSASYSCLNIDRDDLPRETPEQAANRQQAARKTYNPFRRAAGYSPYRKGT